MRTKVYFDSATVVLTTVMIETVESGSAKREKSSRVGKVMAEQVE